MNNQMNVPVSPQPVQPAGTGTGRTLAIIAVIVGVISLCIWLIPFIGPFIGILFGLVGAVLGFLGLRDANAKTLAIIGISVSVIGLLVSCVVPFGLVALMNLLGPKIGNTFSSINNSLP